MARQITLTLDNGIYNVLRCNYVFNRGIDYRGLPTTGLLGGDIKLEIETTGDDYLWERLSGRKPRPVSGKLEIFDVEEMSPIRVLEWYDGYIYAVEEGMYSLSSLPMTQKVLITTKRMDINSVVKLDRRFPETSGFWWEEYKEPEPVVVVEEESDKEEDTTPHIVSIAWLDEEDKSITFIPSGLEETVTMHVETTGFDKPENGEEDVLVQIKDEEERVFFEYTTRPNEEGVIDLDLTVEEIISEKHDNPVEYLKEHPNLKLCLFASCLHNPDEQKEAILEKEQPEIVRLEWQDNKRTVLTHVPEGQNKYVDIYIEAKKFKTDEEGKCPDSLCYEILDDDKNKIYEGAATLNENGSCIIGGFDLQGDIDQYLAENKLPALTTRPFNYTLRAWFESNPDDPKEAVIQEEVQCTVQFRRDGTYHPVSAKNAYKGDFLFDWYREGDDEDPLNGWYKNIMKKGFKEFVDKNYSFFDEEWKKKHRKYENNYRYLVPSMTIVPGFTARLKLKLTVEKPVKQIKLKITGGNEEVFSLNFNSFTIKKKDTNHLHTEKLEITCKKVFDKPMFLEAYAEETKVGQLEFIPNHEPYKINIVVIPIKMYEKDNDIKKVQDKALNVSTITAPKLSNKEVKRIKELFQQLYIFPEIKQYDALDCTKIYDILLSRDMWTGKEEREERTLLNKYFVNERGHIISTKTRSTPKDRIKFEIEKEKKLEGKNLFNYLEELSKIQYGESALAKSWLVFVFPAQGATALGVADISYRTDWKDYVLSKKSILFDVNLTLGRPYSPYTFVHEVLHSLAQEHPFENYNYKKDYEGVFYQYQTDNIMDYTKYKEGETRPEIVEDKEKRYSLWKWQFEKARGFLKQKYGSDISNYKYEKL